MQAAAATAPKADADTSSTDMDWQQQQQQQHLPRLAELCLFRVQVSYQALSALAQSSGTQLSRLKLLQLTMTHADPPPAAAAAPLRGPLLQQSPAAGNTSSSSSYLTTEQLLSLPVAWGCLQELHIHPYQLWGMLTAGCMARQGAKATHNNSSSSSSGSEGAAQRLRHLTQLLNLRHLYVVNAPISFAAASPPTPAAPPGLAARIPSVGLPLHEPQSMRRLLSALQAGLQQLPALRQLLSYMGPVTPLVEVPADDADALGDVWMDAGEALLQALPAVRVREFRPSIHLPRSVQDAAAVQVVNLPQEPQGGFDVASAAAVAGSGGTGGQHSSLVASAAAAAAVSMQQQQQQTQQEVMQQGQQALFPATAAAAAGADHVGMQLEGPAAVAPAAADAPAPQAGVQSTVEGGSHQQDPAWMEPEYMI
jgi:hypothetical protein